MGFYLISNIVLQITCTLAGKAMNNLNPQTQLYASGIVFNLSAVDFGFTESLDVLIEPLCPEEQPMGGSVNEERICHLKAHNKIFLQVLIQFSMSNFFSNHFLVESPKN